MQKIDYAWVIVGATALTGMTTHAFGRFSYTMIIPSMMQGMALTKSQAGLIQSFHFWGYLTFSFLGGFLAARYSPRLIITLSVLLIGLSMIGTGMTNSFFSALVMRTFTGIGTGAAYVPAVSLLSIWFRNERRGLASGLVSIGAPVGLILISQLVPWIVMSYKGEGWRYSWYYLGLAPVFMTFICAIFFRNKPADLEKERVQGTGYEGQRMGLLRNKPVDLKKDTLQERNAPNYGSSKWVEVLSNKDFWHLGVIYATFGFSYVILMTFYPVYLFYQRQMPSSYYGNLFMVMAMTFLVGGTFWGKISDWIGRRGALIMVFSMMSLSYLIVSILQNPLGDYAGVMVYGFGAWAIPTIMIAAIGDYAGPAMASSALGFITLIFGIGQALGPWVAGYLADSTGSFIPAFYLASGVGLLGLVVLLFLRKPVIYMKS